jgi:hypothetical protein
MTAIPESREVRRWRWRQEDAAFDVRDRLFGQAHRLWYVALLVLATLAAS